MTLSIAASDQSSDWFGAAISSSSICVASRCLHWRAGVDIAPGQNITRALDPGKAPCYGVPGDL